MTLKHYFGKLMAPEANKLGYHYQAIPSLHRTLVLFMCEKSYH